jgi:hypothetical protein
MENAARLYHRQNHPQKNAQAPDTGGLFTRLTAVFRLKLSIKVRPSASRPVCLRVRNSELLRRNEVIALFAHN